MSNLQILKKIFVLLVISGIILGYLTASTSDYAIESGNMIMTDEQMMVRVTISILLMIGGFVGYKLVDIFYDLACKYKYNNFKDEPQKFTLQ